jgi:Flp pilus assembly protein TadD
VSVTNDQLTLDEARSALRRGHVASARERCEAILRRNSTDAAAWNLLGLAQQQSGQAGEGLDALAKAASLEPQNAKYQHDFGNALLDAGRIDRAITAYRRALRLDQTLAKVHNDLGTAYFQKQWYEQAEACFRQAIQRDPAHGVAHANLGAALRALGRLKEGRKAYQRALLLKVRAALPRVLRWRVDTQPAPALDAHEDKRKALEDVAALVAQRKLAEARKLALQSEQRFPQDPEVLFALAKVLAECFEFGAALKRVAAAIESDGSRIEYYMAQARLLCRLGDRAGAANAAERALRLAPGSAQAHATLAVVYHTWREELAEQAARRAVALEPTLALAQSTLAVTLWASGRLGEAERHAREAVRLEPHDPNAQINLANILNEAGRIEEASIFHRQVAAQDPADPEICLNLGTLALDCNADLAAARHWYAKAQSHGENPHATLSQGVADLLEAQFASGWPKFEARKVLEAKSRHDQFAAFAPWNGQPVRSGRVLVYGEQGLGDEILFASMAQDVMRHVPRVTLLCDPRLHRLFARSFAAIEVVPAARDVVPELTKQADAAVAAGSLGMFFRPEPRAFPEHRGYLVPDEARVREWRNRLDSLSPATFKVGLSWLGGVLKTGRNRRSLSPAELRPLLATPGVAYISLQHGDVTDEVTKLSSMSRTRFHVFPDVTADIDNLAALIAALDLVISVCNTNVHVAGALGKEVWVVAPLVPLWMYGLKDSRMPWYPSARIFRQGDDRRWDVVVQAVTRALDEKLRGRSA